MSRSATVAFLATASIALAACQTGGMQRAEVMPAQPRGIEGTWSAVGGPVAYTATFQNGRFTSNEGGTGAVLADGSYSTLGPNQIAINYTSRARGEQVSVNCNRMAENRLACVNAGGSRFELSRQA